MNVLTFKTNLKCNGCIAAVKPALDSIEGLGKWDVDLNSPDKIMHAEVTSVEIAGAIVSAYKKSGYEAEETD